MRHNLKQEYRSSMDAIRFSPEAQAAMAEKLAAHGKEQAMHHRTSGKILLTAAVLAALLATLTGAAVFSRWSKTAQSSYNPSQQIKEQSEKSGLSTVLETKSGKKESDAVLSTTDQGITVTAVQTLVDNLGGEITFRIEGFDLPEGRDPWAYAYATIEGDHHFYCAYTASFFDGTTHNEEGKWVYASDGSPVKFDDTQPYSPAILDYVAADGSLEYTMYFTFLEEDGRYLDKEIQIHFSGFGVGSTKKAGEPEKLVDGSWDLHWTLTGSNMAKDSIPISPNVKVGDTDITLLDGQVGQKSLALRFQLESYWEGFEKLETFPADLQGIRMKDGSIVQCYPRSQGYTDMEKLIFESTYQTYQGILDLDQAEYLLFHKGWEKDAQGKPTLETYYEIPIR